MESFAVRHVIAHSGMYEERITLWEASSEDAAIAHAEAESAEYAKSVKGECLGLFQSYRLSDPPGQGREIFSLIRSSNLPSEQYLDAFFSTGSEHERTDN
jgi:hypothetical protein